MVATRASTRQRSTRCPFLVPCWDDDHPEFRRIDASLAPDHHARWLLAVTAHLDLEPLRRSYANRGSRAYPVERLLPFVLFMYSQGLLSPTDWARHAKHDDQAKWLLRGLLPSRPRLYSFRDRLEPFLDDFHKQLIAWALAEGITTATRGSLDGTFVAALASRHRLSSPRRVDDRLLRLRLLVFFDDNHDAADLPSPLARLPEGVLLTVLWLVLVAGVTVPALANALLGLSSVLEWLRPDGKGLPAALPSTVAGRRRVLQRYEAAQQRLREKLQPYQHKKKLSKKDQEALERMKVSPTDPQAALGWDKMGTFRPLYNVLLVQATDAPLTLAFDVLARNNDDGLLAPMMAKTKEQLGRHLEEVLVDGAFVNVGDVAWCEQQGITVYAPPSKTETAQAEVSKAEGEKPELAKAAGDQAGAAKAASPPAAGGAAEKEPKLPKAAFRYDKEEKVYYCPAGKRMEAVSHTTVKRQNGMELPMIVHRASGQDCQACPRQKECTSNAKKGRVVKRYEGEEALERLQQRMAEPANQQIYKLRKQSVERGYAEMKEHRGLRVFRVFGPQRSRAQAALVILASNGLNIMRARQRRRDASPPPAPQEKQPA
jgi:transposase